MAGSGGGAPPSSEENGGEFLLSLLQRRPHHHQSQTPQSNLQPPHHEQTLAVDPAVAAMGPSLTLSPPFPSNGPDLFSSPLPPWAHTHHSLSSPIPPNFIGFQHPQNPFHPPGNVIPGNQIPGNHAFLEDLRKLGVSGNDSNLIHHKQKELGIRFGSFPQNPLGFVNGNISFDSSNPEVTFENGNRSHNGFDRNHQSHHPVNLNSSNANSSAFTHGNYDSRKHPISSSENRRPPPGFLSKPQIRGENWDSGKSRRGLAEHNVDKEKYNFGGLGFGEEKVTRISGENGQIYRDGSDGHGGQLDRPKPTSVSDLQSASASEIEGTLFKLHRDLANGDISREVDDVGEQLVDSLLLEDEADEKNESKHHHREKESRLDKRGNQLLPQRMRFLKRQMQCRGDIDRLNTPFLAIFESLIPPEEEKAKQKQLMTLLEKLVIKEWPKARLYLYGSCANSFGVSKSDIDVCLALEEAENNKSEVLLKLSDILQSDNLQNVQALTRARVPIVKLMDPVTGISCDICINNVLAVVNTKLLLDYAQVDVRLRQLAFIVKHWAKSRGVNETYQGTLSSYAYVLMCIHFLQQRRPAILPCLQGMEATFSAIVDDIECAYFDKVEKLRDFGSYNKESIAQLVWAFFNYWAYRHDYSNAVISVRTGSIISKRAKDWTRRIGNDRHLICIEDPFETSHDLGRVVDKYSIKVLREEFERAADIMQFEPNPCLKLFEPYVPS